MPKLHFGPGAVRMPKVDVRLNSVSGTTGNVPALLDTGASFSFVCNSVAAGAGINPLPGATEQSF